MRKITILLFLCLTLTSANGAWASVDFSGTWVGHYTNDGGQTAQDSLQLSWTGDGYTGTWSQMPVKAREINGNTIEIWGSTAKRSYLGTGSFDGTYLTIYYTASRLDQGGSYTGSSVLRRP
jgi:hypothetical protein